MIKVYRMVKFLDYLTNDNSLGIFEDSARAYACFMFDKKQLKNTRIAVDQLDLNAIGQVNFRFLGLVEQKLDIYIKFDIDFGISELVFETDSRQFCTFVDSRKFISQDELEWNRLANYWIGLLSNPSILKRTFNYSLTCIGLPISSIKWDLYPAYNVVEDRDDKSVSEKTFENSIPQICHAFSLELKLNLLKPSQWKFQYIGDSKYGYFLECKKIEIRLLVHLDRMRLSILHKDSEEIWFDLPPETITNMNEKLQSAILDSLFVAEPI